MITALKQHKLTAITAAAVVGMASMPIMEAAAVTTTIIKPKASFTTITKCKVSTSGGGSGRCTQDWTPEGIKCTVVQGTGPCIITFE